MNENLNNHDAAIADLRSGAMGLVSLDAKRRIELLDQCIVGVEEHWQEWVENAWAAKRIPQGSSARAEDITMGPVPTVRCLHLLRQTIRDIVRSGTPQLPGGVRTERGHLRIPVFPTSSLYDRLLFGPIKAEVRMPAGATVETMFGDNLRRATGQAGDPPCVTLVLGAGNVTSIPITDALSKIFQFNQTVLLKMNPVNAYVGPVFEKAFSPLIKQNLLRIVYGDGRVGADLVSHPSIDGVHITGSDRTHDAIVWGADSREQMRRKKENDRVLEKPITSELGNVSPWIIFPGRYSRKQLRAQAENIVASVTSNVSFVCIATKMLVTHRNWPQRAEFLKMIEEVLSRVPRRFAYYPGARERFTRFAGDAVSLVDADQDCFPWTFRRDADIDELPHLFEEESFVGVFGETALDAVSPEEFLDTAIDFVNERMWGTLAAAITIPSRRSGPSNEFVAEAVDRLRYGTVGINQWPGVGFALMSTPWGAYPGGTLQNVGSGIGIVHNTFLLDRPEQAVLSSPLTVMPKPMWFSTHRCPEAVARNLMKLYTRPGILRVPPVVIRSLFG